MDYFQKFFSQGLDVNGVLRIGRKKRKLTDTGLLVLTGYWTDWTFQLGYWTKIDNSYQSTSGSKVYPHGRVDKSISALFKSVGIYRKMRTVTVKLIVNVRVGQYIHFPANACSTSYLVTM